MKLKRRFALAPIAVAAMLLCAPAHAVPKLQLDILGGTYDTATQTIMASGNSFSLYAYYWSTTLPTGNFYISAALMPPTATPGNYGSFTIDGGAPINVTSDMAYGTPPLELAMQAFDPGDLSKHGIFPGYFYEKSFTFSAANQSGVYNTQDHAGWGPQSGTGMFYQKFDFNIAGLAPGLGLHFDFYNESIKNGDIDVNKFAPFSHDAQGMVASIPEPETYAMLLAGLGLLGFAARRRKLKEAAVA